MRKLLAALTAAGLIAGAVPVLAGLPPGGTFSDDDGNVHEPNIEAIAAAGVTQGCDAAGTLFCPDDPVSRAQMASFLARGLGLDPIQPPPPATTTSAATTTTDVTTTSTTPAGSVWQPAPGTTWQWQLQDTIDTSFDVEMYDVDLFDTPESVIDQLHADGRIVVCYLSAGSWEDWRPDAGDFPDAVKGNDLDGWPGEKWLDIRQLDVLARIMEARLDLCRDKGFDGVEPDNIDAYTNNTGFALTAADQLAYNRFLAAAAHARGLSIGLKNDLDQVVELEADFDWAINEECYTYDECDLLVPFIDAGKAVFHVEYDNPTSEFCPVTTALGFSSIRKNLDLDAWREPCP